MSLWMGQMLESLFGTQWPQVCRWNYWKNEKYRFASNLCACTEKDSDRSKCNVSSAWKDQMLLSDFVATATENTSRLGYKHVCVNYLHVASHDYQEMIQHTHPHTHSLWELFSFFFSFNSHLSFNMNSNGKWKFQKLLNQKHKSQACHKQTKEGTKVQKANIAR